MLREQFVFYRIRCQFGKQNKRSFHWMIVWKFFFLKCAAVMSAQPRILPPLGCHLGCYDSWEGCLNSSISRDAKSAKIRDQLRSRLLHRGRWASLYLILTQLQIHFMKFSPKDIFRHGTYNITAFSHTWQCFLIRTQSPNCLLRLYLEITETTVILVSLCHRWSSKAKLDLYFCIKKRYKLTNDRYMHSLYTYVYYVCERLRSCTKAFGR